MGVGISVLALVWHAARTGDSDATLPIISRDSDAPVPFLVAIAVEPHGAYIEYNFSGMPESAKGTVAALHCPETSVAQRILAQATTTEPSSDFRARPGIPPAQSGSTWGAAIVSE